MSSEKDQGWLSRRCFFLHVYAMVYRLARLVPADTWLV